MRIKKNKTETAKIGTITAPKFHSTMVSVSWALHVPCTLDLDGFAQFMSITNGNMFHSFYTVFLPFKGAC